jgi:hypothetical protein
MGFSGLAIPTWLWTSVALAVALGVIATGAIFYFLAAWLRFGTIAGLVYTFVIDAFVQGASGTMQKLSAMYYVRSVVHDLTDAWFAAGSARVAREVADAGGTWVPPRPGGPVLPDASRIEWLATKDAVLVLLVLTAAVLALGLRVVSRRDYSLKE